VRDYLQERYPEIETDFSAEASRLGVKSTIPDLLMVETNVAVFLIILAIFLRATDSG
jgi:hypothetical protein